MKFIEMVLLWLIFTGFPTLTLNSAYGKPDFEEISRVATPTNSATLTTIVIANSIP